VNVSGPKRIPFNRATTVGRELDYVRESLASGQTAGDGEFGRRCERLLEQELGVRRALLTTSCTHALEMSALLLDVGPGDEVIVPSFTFVSTASAFALRGARPVFCDVRDDTLTLDPEDVRRKLGARTKAVVAVHYGGLAPDVAELVGLAAERGVTLVEDNAHGLFGRSGGRPLGGFGRLATLSFHATKNFSCGEGGALLINDPSLVARAEIVREKGTDRQRFFRGEVDKYTWVDLGSSYVISDLLAAYLWGQLERREEVGRRRRELWERYRTELSPWAERHGVGLPPALAAGEPTHHVFYLRLPSGEARDAMIRALGERGIQAVFHYLPLHLSPMGSSFGGRPGDCPVTESVSERLVRLPLFHSLSDDEQARVIAAVLAR